MVKSANIASRGALRARKFQAFSAPLTVGAVHTLAGLRLAERLESAHLDVVELRVDALLDHLLDIERALARIKLPVLVTVRHPGEGGIGDLSASRRRELLHRFLPHATWVDLELRSFLTLADVAEETKAAGVKLVVSDHHFRRAPSLEAMVERQRRAFRHGANVFKLATVLPGPREFARLMEFAAQPASGARALMGMGKFGQVSRLALAQSGSVLNYGYLDRPNAPGQWEARELKALIQRISAK